MVLPTKRILLRGIPSRTRFRSPSSEGVSKRSAIWSVNTRFISSGILRSNERKPDSTCATLTPTLLHTRAAATVELTSP